MSSARIQVAARRALSAAGQKAQPALRRSMSSSAQDKSNLSWVGRKRTVHDVNGYTPFRPISRKDMLPEHPVPTRENFKYYDDFAAHEASKFQNYVAFGITFVCGYWMAARAKHELPVMFGTGKPWDH